MLPALIFAAVAATPAPADRCTAYTATATAFAKPERITGGASEGEDAVRATRAWRGANLTYVFAIEHGPPPFCAVQHLIYERDGFSFEQDAGTAHDAIALTLGSDVADDFAHAKIIAATKDPAQGENFRHVWYRGALYGYMTSTLSNALDIYPFDMFGPALGAAQIQFGSRR